MNPRPPFSWELTLEQEIAAFERLKPRLQDVWATLTMRDEEPHTSVVVPSLTLDRGSLAKLAGASFYEERLLFLLMRLRNPRARMVFVTSQPVHPLTLEYYFQLLAGIPASHARSRLTLLCAYDASPRSLTEKVLERPRLIQRIRDGIQNPARAYLTVFNATPLERRLAVLLGIPMNGADPQLAHLGTKSGSRKVFRDAGVALPEGMENLRDRTDVEAALIELRRRRPRLRKAVIKLDDSFSGEGNAIFRYPDRGPAARAAAAAPEAVVARSRTHETPESAEGGEGGEGALGRQAPVRRRAGGGSSPAAVRDALAAIELSVADETPDSYFAKFGSMGGVVEEFIEGREKTSPSTQLRISPYGEVLTISTHDQILGGPSQQVFLGCRFPARDDYRMRMQEAAVRIGEVLAAHGVVSRFAVDFLAWRDDPTSDWNLAALEINLRMGGTTHPYLALQFLTGGSLDRDTGLFWSPTGHTKCYVATDNLRSEAYRGLLPEDLIEILTETRLHYSLGTESGTLFHLIGAVSEFGKLGVTAIADTHEEADAIYQRALAVLDRETAVSRPGFQGAGGAPSGPGLPGGPGLPAGSTPALST
ncbi:MAG TPA: peptide ligase PGM1-related protein [Thermoanaerobaculia bacterium]|nr:peptide ligase PGM1-related protein [Thermoanaerobaculia bacterium]